MWSQLKMSLMGSHCGAAEANPTRNHEVAGLIPDLTQWVKDLPLLWLWCRPVATALKKKKKKKKKILKDEPQADPKGSSEAEMVPQIHPALRYAIQLFVLSVTQPWGPGVWGVQSDLPE